MSQFKHIRLLTQFTEDARSFSNPWQFYEIQDLDTEDWLPLTTELPFFAEEREYRRIPTARFVEAVSIPQPVQATPFEGDTVFYVDFDKVRETKWKNNQMFDNFLRQGRIHYSFEAANTCRIAVIEKLFGGEL